MKKENSKKISKREFPGFTLQPKEGYYKLHKIGLTRERVRQDPAFLPARQSARDFTRALLLAQEMASLLVVATGIKSPVRRLAGAIRKALSQDQRNAPGFCKLRQENAQPLHNLSLNKRHSWRQHMKVEPAIKMGSSNEYRLTWPPTMPGKDWILPAPYTHLRIKACLLAMDATDTLFLTPWQQTGAMPYKQLRMPGKQMLFKLPVTTINCCIVVVFGQWYTQNRAQGDKIWIDVPGPLKLKIA